MQQGPDVITRGHYQDRGEEEVRTRKITDIGEFNRASVGRKAETGGAGRLRSYRIGLR